MRWTRPTCGIGDEAAYELDAQLGVFAGLGLQAIELRTVAGRWPHELADDERAELATMIATSGLTVPVVDTPLGGWSTTIGTDEATELAILERSAAVARAVGCEFLRVMSYPDDGRGEPAWGQAVRRRLGLLARAAADQGVVLLHENCHGWAAVDPARARDLIEDVGSGALGLIFDIGNGAAYGYSAVDYLTPLLPWVRHVHVKDAIVGADGSGEFTIPGTGDVAVASCLRMLDAAGYTGWLSLEPHVAHIPHLGRTTDPASLARGFAACAEGFRALLSQTLPLVEVGEPVHG